MSNSVLNKEQQASQVLEFEPMQFKNMTPDEAKDFVIREAKGTSFAIDKVVSEQTGITELKKISRQKLVEEEALKHVKEIEEKAYEEAYKLGLEEGKVTAFDDMKSDIQKKLGDLEAVLQEVRNMKILLFKKNESHIVKLCFYLAKRIMMREVEINKESVIAVIKRSIEIAHTEEDITVRVSENDLAFVENNLNLLGMRPEILERIKLEADASMTDGGAIIDTNYGIIDASLEQRISKLEDIITDVIPK